MTLQVGELGVSTKVPTEAEILELSEICLEAPSPEFKVFGFLELRFWVWGLGVLEV